VTSREPGRKLDSGEVVGAYELNPWTIAAGTLIGGIVGGIVGYEVCSGAFVYLYDVLYD